MRLPLILSRQKCRMAYVHDFPDYRCYKCSPLTKGEWAIKIVGLALIIIGSIILL